MSLETIDAYLAVRGSHLAWFAGSDAELTIRKKILSKRDVELTMRY